MAERPLKIDEFHGLVTNADPHDLPPGAASEQSNVQCLVPGQLNVRPGTRAVTFGSGSAGTAVVTLFRCVLGNTEWLIGQSSGGAVNAGSGAA